MKKSYLKILTLVMIVPLVSTSCASNDKSIKIAYNLDLLYQIQDNNENANYWPIEINSQNFVDMINGKQTFCLYFNQDNCAICNDLTSPHFKRYLANENTAYGIYSLNASYNNFQIIDNNTNYGNLFSEGTPKIYYFKNGEYINYMSDKRFSSYKLFEEAMTMFLSPSNIYVSEKETSIQRFLNEEENYLLYFMAPKTNEKSNSIYQFSYQYYGENVFNPMSEKSFKTLVINNEKLDIDYLNNLYNSLGLQRQVGTYAYYKKGDAISSYDYSNAEESKELLKLIKDID